MTDAPEKKKAGPSDRPQWVRDLGILMATVTEVVAGTGVGLGLGYLLWTRAGFPWWILLLGALLGLAMAMYRVYRLTR